MVEIEELWRMADAASKVCSKTGATKNMVLDAIMNGAKTAADVRKKVDMCRGECAAHNPSGRPCGDNVEAILAVYLPVYEMMTDGGGCHGCSGKH